MRETSDLARGPEVPTPPPGRVARGLRSRERRPRQRQWYPLVYGFVLALWAASWNLRLSVLLAWMPVEPVVVASVALALCVAHCCGQAATVAPRAAGAILIVLLSFIPGVLSSGSNGYAPHKVGALALIVLPVLLASTLLLSTPAARRGWLWSQLLVGAAVAIAAVSTSHETLLQPGRFSLATVNTVSTGRLVGVAVVVLLLVMASSRQQIWWALPSAAGCGMVLVQVGSRGPLLFALIAVVVVIATAKCFAGRRERLLSTVAAAAAAATVYALVAGGEGGQRVLTSLREGLIDSTRQHLLADAVQAGAGHPWGVGWGDFLDYSSTARSIANAQGVSYAHNAFAEAFSEGGIPALLGFVVFVVVAIVRLQRLTSDPREAIVWGTLLYWLLNALVSLDFVGNHFMWIALACAISCDPGPAHRAPLVASSDETRHNRAAHQI